jgi:hypothetical protein
LAQQVRSRVAVDVNPGRRRRSVAVGLDVDINIGGSDRLVGTTQIDEGEVRRSHPQVVDLLGAIEPQPFIASIEFNRAHPNTGVIQTIVETGILEGGADGLRQRPHISITRSRNSNRF